ncbi:MAG: CapA family protein [Oscillospiraceae bacterium]
MKICNICLSLCLMSLSVILLNSCSKTIDESSLPKIVDAAASVSVPSIEIKPEVKVEPKKVRFSATGDNLIHDGIYKQAAARANNLGYDFIPLYAHMQDFYKQFDVNWINQETLITDEFEPSSYPCFCTPEALGNAAYDLGFRVFSTSNNHSYDKGAKGIDATLRYWDKMPNDTINTGFFSEETLLDIPMHEVNGIKIAYLAYTQHTNGIHEPQGANARVILTDETEIIKAQIEKANEIADFVIVGVHWGNEGSHNITDGQKQLGQIIADYGADAIIGTHPHVIQPLEFIKSADNRSIPIAYSLGNFVSAQSAADNLIGLICSFDIIENTNGDFEAQNLAATPIVTHYNKNFRNISVYLYSDYTDELAGIHGVRERMPDFSKNYINKVINNTINPDFIKFE